MRKSKTRWAALAMACLMAAAFPLTAMAKSPDTAFLRAKIEYKSEDGTSRPISNDDITVADGWTLDGEYWYYKEPVKDGATVDFLQSVQIPREWDSAASGAKFQIIVKADAAENVNGKPAWGGLIDGVDKNTSGVIGLDLTLIEYELDAAGNRIPYQNDKVVYPGDVISKIVSLGIKYTYKPSSSGGGGGGGGGGGHTTPKPDPTKETPTVSEKPTEPTAPNPPALAKTGDTAHTAFYLAAAGVALAGIVIIIKKQKK